MRRGNSKNFRNLITLPNVLIIAITLRISWAFFARTDQISDFSDYVNRALTFSENHSITRMGEPNYLRMPGWPLLLSIFSNTGLNKISVTSICVLLSTLLVYLSYSLLRNLGFEKHSSELFALFVAIFPPFIQFASVAAAEHMALVIFALSAIAYFKISSDGFLSILLKGAILGAPTLVRPEYIFLTPLAVFFLSSLHKRTDNRSDGSKNKNSATLKLLLLISGYLTIPITWMVFIFFSTKGEGFGLTTAAGCNLLMAINPDQSYGYSNNFASYCATFQSQKDAISIVLKTILSFPGILLIAIFRGLSLFFTSPSNYGIDWSFTCWGDGFCASEVRKNWKFGSLAEDVARTLNGYVLLGLYALSGNLIARAKTPRGKSTKKIVLRFVLFLLGYFVYSSLLAPFNVRFRFAFDWMWLLVLSILASYSGRETRISK